MSDEIKMPASSAAALALSNIENSMDIIQRIIHRDSSIAWGTQLEVAQRYYGFLNNEAVDVLQRIGELEAQVRNER